MGFLKRLNRIMSIIYDDFLRRLIGVLAIASLPIAQGGG